MFQEFIEILILSAIQGVSEFLPISSSAHLILISNLYDLKASSLLIDISLHLGSLLAIIFFFRKDLFDLRNNQKLLSLIIIGSIPLMTFGYILHTTELIHHLRNIKIILCLGKVAFDSILKFYNINYDIKLKNYKFSHGVEYILPDNKKLLGSYHPSPRNVNTKKIDKFKFIKLLTNITRKLKNENQL